jgi:PAS domain S-box-containing protein
MRLTDATSNLLDATLNLQMQDNLGVVLTEYNRSGHDPAKMDLAKIKQTLGEDYEIYLINSSGVIEYTTSPSELGQDFRQIPYFYDYLTKIRNSEGFYPDRVVRDNLGTGQFRKFAYMPTPDHAYILELGYASSLFSQKNSVMDDKSNIEKIVDVNPYIDQYDIYNSMNRRVDDNSLPDTRTRAYLTQVIDTRQTLEVVNTSAHQKIRFLYVDLKKPESGTDPSRVVELVYNTSRLHYATEKLVMDHFLFGFFSIAVGCLLAFLISLYVTRPIKKISHDVDLISHGDSGHRIGRTNIREFARLEQGINTMLDSLNAAQQMLRDDEVFRKNLIDQLPVGIFVKNTDTGRYIFWNAANERIYEIPAAEILGKTDREVFALPDALRIELEDQETKSSRMVIKYKKIMTLTQGERVVHLYIVPIYDAKKSVRYTLGIVEDITEETSNLKKDLLISISRSDILEQLAHIMTYLEQAQLKATDEAINVFFQETLGSVEAIKNQIAFVRTLQDIGVIEPRWQSVQAAFLEAVALLPPHTVRITDDIEGIEINADPLLPRIFYSLLINSLRHGGNSLTMIHLESIRKDHELVIIYEDNGKGVPATEKEKIFEFGYGNDTGLGLFLIRELLRFTDITITETGKPLSGARFEIHIPRGQFRVIQENDRE